MQDTQKFCEHMNNYNWCEGLPLDVLNTVLSYFAPGEEIPMSSRTAQTNLSTSQKGTILRNQLQRSSVPLQLSLSLCVSVTLFHCYNCFDKQVVM